MLLSASQPPALPSLGLKSTLPAYPAFGSTTAAPSSSSSFAAYPFSSSHATSLQAQAVASTLSSSTESHVDSNRQHTQRPRISQKSEAIDAQGGSSQSAKVQQQQPARKRDPRKSTKPFASQDQSNGAAVQLDGHATQKRRQPLHSKQLQQSHEQQQAHVAPALLTSGESSSSAPPVSDSNGSAPNRRNRPRTAPASDMATASSGSDGLSHEASSSSAAIQPSEHGNRNRRVHNRGGRSGGSGHAEASSGDSQPQRQARPPRGNSAAVST
jgi:hypothetical protein